MKSFLLQHPSGFSISAQFTEEDAAKSGQLTVKHSNGYNWYSLPVWKEPNFVIGLSLCFFYGKLVHVHLAAIDDAFGTSWDDWSEEKERLRIKKTNEWLEKNDLKAGTYDWGTVSCGYDRKADSGGAEIWLFCNQNVFLGQKLSMVEFSSIRQLLINMMGCWQKNYAQELGFTEDICKAVYRQFPTAKNEILSALVVLNCLNFVIKGEANEVKPLISFVKLKKRQLKLLHSKLLNLGEESP
jgi:hypothetical protein